MSGGLLRTLPGIKGMLSLFFCLGSCPYFSLAPRRRSVVQRCCDFVEGELGGGRSLCHERIMVKLVRNFFFRLYGVFGDRTPATTTAIGGGDQGRCVFRHFCRSLVRSCRSRHDIGFCTSRLYLAPGRLSNIIGRIDNGAIKR